MANCQYAVIESPLQRIINYDLFILPWVKTSGEHPWPSFISLTWTVVSKPLLICQSVPNQTGTPMLKDTVPVDFFLQ